MSEDGKRPLTDIERNITEKQKQYWEKKNDELNLIYKREDLLVNGGLIKLNYEKELEEHRAQMKLIKDQILENKAVINNCNDILVRGIEIKKVQSIKRKLRKLEKKQQSA